MSAMPMPPSSLRRSAAFRIGLAGLVLLLGNWGLAYYRYASVGMTKPQAWCVAGVYSGGFRCQWARVQTPELFNYGTSSMGFRVESDVARGDASPVLGRALWWETRRPTPMLTQVDTGIAHWFAVACYVVLWAGVMYGKHRRIRRHLVLADPVAAVPVPESDPRHDS